MAQELYKHYSDSGSLYTFGSNYFGCLGVGEKVEKLLLPTKIDFFDDKPLVQIKCGSHHVVAMDLNNNVYSWGCNEFGTVH